MNLFILLQLFVLSFIDQLLHYVELLDFPFVYYLSFIFVHFKFIHSIVIILVYNHISCPSFFCKTPFPCYCKVPVCLL